MFDNYYWLIARVNYQPTVLARFTVYTDRRNAMEVLQGISTDDRPAPDTTWSMRTWAMGGGLALDGTDVPGEATFYLDMSDLLVTDSDATYFLGLFGMQGTDETLYIRDVTLFDAVRDIPIASKNGIINVLPWEDAYADFTFVHQDATAATGIAQETENLVFEDADIFSQSSLRLVFANTGTDMLIIDDIDDCPQFSIDEAIVYPIYIPRYQSFEVPVVFAPAVSGESICTFSVTSNADDYPVMDIPLQGTGISNNIDGDLKLYATPDPDPVDNAVEVDVTLVNDGSVAMDLSGYIVVYYFNQQNLFIQQMTTQVTSDDIPGIGVQLERLPDTYGQSVKQTNLAANVNFPAGSVLNPQESVVFTLQVTSQDGTTVFFEDDDWSHYTAANGLAENMLIVDTNTMEAVFGNSPLHVLYHVPVRYAPETEEIVFEIEDQSVINTYYALIVEDGEGNIVDYRYLKYDVHEGTNSVLVENLPDGAYVARIEKDNETLTSVAFVKGGILGDVNNDGTIIIVDSLLVGQNYVYITAEPFYPKLADVNADGVINIVDSLLIAQLYVGIITEFPSN